jgi:hypothetical protein
VEKVASRERETQWRTKEFGDWNRGRSYAAAHEQVDERRRRELDARGIPMTEEDEQEGQSEKWKCSERYLSEQLNLTEKTFEGELQTNEGLLVPSKSNAYGFNTRWSNKEGCIEPFWVRCALMEDREDQHRRGSSERRVVLDAIQATRSSKGRWSASGWGRV